ncbi:tyrosine-type recombinase/integrase [Nocardioides cheoyonin]|uniref:tyrosine-type recombinase/integrase n=1 Tax=Nocardioides cheoyonin TaxID=3156615 RepID=UPI0032B43CE7
MTSSKRANGEGSIYRRADGRYEGAVTVLTASGKRKRMRVYTRTRREAHEKLTGIIEDARRGVLALERNWRVDEYLDFWLEREKRRPLTIKRHAQIVRRYLKPALGRHSLDSLTVRMTQGFFDDLLANGTSIATIHQVRKVLSSALTYAMRQEIVMRNVARLVELPRYIPQEAQHWTPDELVRFLNATKSDPLHAAFLLLALYGLRRGEVLGIRWRDVDFEHGVLHIRQQIQRIDGSLQQVGLKTESSRRDEPLLLQAREVLLAQRHLQDQARSEAGSDWHGTGDHNELVFTTRSGRPVESHNLARSFFRICQQNGLRRITIHGLRHSNATAQKSLQVHSRDIQAILGHGDVRTTGIYEHVDLASKRAALEKVEELLFKEADDSGRCRQICRQTPNEARSSDSNFGKKKTPTPVGSVVSLVAPPRLELGTQGSSGRSETSVGSCPTTVNSGVQARTTLQRFGHVAVRLAVNHDEIGERSAPGDTVLLQKAGDVATHDAAFSARLTEALSAVDLAKTHASCPHDHSTEWLIRELYQRLQAEADDQEGRGDLAA